MKKLTIMTTVVIRVSSNSDQQVTGKKNKKSLQRKLSDTFVVAKLFDSIPVLEAKALNSRFHLGVESQLFLMACHHQ